jgi:DNA-binding HxlR family transcriptional regulator
VTEKKSSTQIVLDAVQDLHNQEQVVTREALQELTKLKLTIIDDRLKHLADEGLVHRMQRGVFVPVDQHPPARQISHTELPDGTVVLDVGEEVMHLTPREARTLATMLGARAIQASQIELGNQAVVMNAELALRVRQLERQVKAFVAERGAPESPQLALIG